MPLPEPKKSGNDAAGLTGNADAMFHVVRPKSPRTTGAAGASESDNADAMFHVIGENPDKSARESHPDHMQLDTLSLSAGGKGRTPEGLAGKGSRNKGASEELKNRAGRGEDRSYRSGGDPLSR